MPCFRPPYSYQESGYCYLSFEILCIQGLSDAPTPQSQTKPHSLEWDKGWEHLGRGDCENDLKKKKRCLSWFCCHCASCPFAVSLKVTMSLSIVVPAAVLQVLRIAALRGDCQGNTWDVCVCNWERQGSSISKQIRGVGNSSNATDLQAHRPLPSNKLAYSKER